MALYKTNNNNNNNNNDNNNNNLTQTKFTHPSVMRYNYYNI